MAKSSLMPCSQLVWRCCGEHSAASNILQHDQCSGFLFLDRPAEFLAEPNSACWLLLLLQLLSLRARHRSSAQHFTCWVGIPTGNPPVTRPFKINLIKFYMQLNLTVKCVGESKMSIKRSYILSLN